MRNRPDRCASCGMKEAVGEITREVRSGPLAGEPIAVRPTTGVRLLILTVSGKVAWVTVGRCCADSPDLDSIWKAVLEASSWAYRNREELAKALGQKAPRMTEDQDRKAKDQIADLAWDAPLDVIARRELNVGTA